MPEISAALSGAGTIRFSTSPSTAAPTTGGRRIYAVGDIHGHLLALEELLERLEADLAVSPPASRPLLIFLGDYVDRGPDSRGVLERLTVLAAGGPFEVVALKGNHEDALLRFLDDPNYAASWIENWGETTLRAYAVDPWSGEDVRDRFCAIFPPHHRAFLDGLPLSLTIGDYHFVHAGVRPGIPLNAQDDRDLMWIRYDFLESDADFGKVVVHGHTPSPRPDIRANRIGIDTGVYYTGVLTAVRLEGETRRIIQVIER